MIDRLEKKSNKTCSYVFKCLNKKQKRSSFSYLYTIKKAVLCYFLSFGLLDLKIFNHGWNTSNQSFHLNLNHKRRLFSFHFQQETYTIRTESTVTSTRNPSSEDNQSNYSPFTTNNNNNRRYISQIVINPNRNPTKVTHWMALKNIHIQIFLVYGRKRIVLFNMSKSNNWK